MFLSRLFYINSWTNFERLSRSVGKWKKISKRLSDVGNHNLKWKKNNPRAPVGTRRSCLIKNAGVLKIMQHCHFKIASLLYMYHPKEWAAEQWQLNVNKEVARCVPWLCDAYTLTHGCSFLAPTHDCDKQQRASFRLAYARICSQAIQGESGTVPVEGTGSHMAARGGQSFTFVL